MRLYCRARPEHYADAINATVTAASSNGTILDVRSEARRIAEATGLSPIITARDLFEAGIAARIDMAFAYPQT
jgi:hypothetical protein